MSGLGGGGDPRLTTPQRTRSIRIVYFDINSLRPDHGKAFGEHGVYKDYYCVHEYVHRISLILYWPGVTDRPSSTDAFVYNVDLSATLIDLVGGEVPAHYDGRSFAEGLRESRWPDRDHLVWGHGLHAL